VLYVGTPASIEQRLAAAAGVAFRPIDVRPLESDYTIWHGPDRARYSTLVTSPLSWLRARSPAHRIIKEFKPDVVVGFGGYVCAPIVWAANRNAVPVVLHEQNSVMGKANRQLAAKAHTVALTYECTHEEASHACAGEVIVTGNPVRPSMKTTTRAQARDALGLTDDELFLLVIGGSKGSRSLNNASRALSALTDEYPHVRVLHATGEKNFETVAALLRTTCASPQVGAYEIVLYIDNMGEVMPAADLVIARAGSTSIAEISALGIPAILIPFAHATGDHQTKNAQPLVDAGAAVLLDDAAVDSPQFIDTVRRLIVDDAARNAMREVATRFASLDALAELEAVVLDAGDRNDASHQTSREAKSQTGTTSRESKSQTETTSREAKSQTETTPREDKSNPDIIDSTA
jgi:UDP-N-acetylglucosamine--N-acetylmuramyl-(pentapeptide) pyrophosphoryl-undecaprenol N-acetylglucosamine transferase